MRIEDREQLFENPAGEYRGRPFWAWNGKLTEEELLRQIDIFGQMGFSCIPEPGWRRNIWGRNGSA